MAVLRIDLFNGKIVVGGGGAFATAGILVPLGIQGNIPVTGLVKSYLVWQAASVYQPANSYPSYMGGVGSSTFPPLMVIWTLTVLPPVNQT